MDIANPTIVIIGIAICVFLLIATLALAGGLLGKQNKIAGKRLAKIKMRHGGNAALAAAQAKKNLFVKKEVSLLDNLVPKPEEMRRRLNKTGRDISFKKYVISSIVVGVVVTFSMVILSGLSFTPSLMVGIFGGLFLPHLYINRVIKKRLAKFTLQFPEAIDLIVRGLRAGLPVTESIAAVSREMQDPISTEFAMISDEIRLGKTMDEALWSTAKRLDTPDFKFFVISLAVQQETGGNLAETLTNLTDILRGRTKLKLKIRAMISEGKASAYIIGSLPFIMCGILSLMNPEYMFVMFTNPQGQIALLGAAIWMGIGVFILANMINFEV
ncbi:type II secretion system F family protein [Paremcibacter congregatus]|uniref:Pilus assembly protein TadB n=1 Tax=Paremcibacter congregatus TaxID=2043170 RepID=A0A2G4YRD6_9PROT|nr:type II secretion system F family protein [Paremcibacter congregatus]PHZ84875.1 pilus assembly protein TadB [Paremcibacter congregatus]QDE26151.1 type II secretion system F family protein [Paremcibacter congregatus]